jgi:TonB-linked SusC/RagA family outer membrane protein
MRKHFFHAFSMIMGLLCCMSAWSQKKTVTGKVADSLGAPIPNVTVRLKSTRAGVSTNEEGIFHITASSSDVLIFSNVGYEPQDVRVGDRENISILLRRNTQALNEVVVTALGIKRSRNSLPYATQQITGAEVNRTMNTNFVDNLSGKVAGLQITASNTMGGTNNVVLRGMKSLTGTNQALFVVDGVPYDNTPQARSAYDVGNAASDINPEDIESVSVLKGAAASALYGSRGFNGVILITTKKGSRHKGIGVTVDFGVNVGTPDKSTLPQYQEMYGEGFGSAASTNPGNPNPFFYYKPTFNSNGQNVQIVQTDVDQVTGPAYDPSLMVYNWDAFSPGNPNYGKATPWQPAAHHKVTDYFETPITTSTTVSADGGGDKGTFKLGYTRSDDKGYLPNSNQIKNQFTITGTQSLTDRLTISGQVNYSNVTAVGRYGYGYSGSNGTAVNPMTDFRQWWQTNVDLHAQKADYFRTRTNATWNWLGGYTTNIPGNIVKPAYHDNPYFQRYENYENDSRSRYFGYAMANYKATDYLNFMARVSMDTYNQMIETRYNVGAAGTSSYTRYNAAYTETNYDFIATFDKNILNKLNLKALLGTNIRQDNNSSINATTNGGLVVPSFYALANSVNTPDAPVETLSTKEVDGIFGQATLSYDQFLTLDATLRRDRSSTLPKQNNSYYYPSVSGNFVFSHFLQDQPWLSYGKLRANYASVGNDAPVYYTKNSYSSVNPFQGQTLFGATTTNNNPTLLPEQTHSYEFGLEMSFLKSRVGFDVTYYGAKTINEITPVSISTASGYNNFVVNGGTIQNKGVEVSLNLVPVRTHDFTWTMNINWSANRNKVLSLYGGQPSYTITKFQNSVQLVAEVGKPYGVLRGSDFMYKDGKVLVDTAGHNVLSTNKLSDIGNINPDWFGGITNTFNYKNFALSFLVDMRQGGQLYSLDMDYGASAGITPETAGYNSDGKPVRSPLSAGGGYVNKGVTADGKPNTKKIDASDINTGNFPFSSFFGMAHKSYVYSASYIKLREASLSWSLPKRVVDKLNFVKGLEFALTGRNLWIIHKSLPYSDPEQGVANNANAGQNGSMGFQSGAYPVFRTFGANIRVKF